MPMNERQRVAHLLRRAGFGASPAELDEYEHLGFDASVERLLNPESVEEVDFEQTGLDESTPLSLKLIQTRWLYRMIHTRRPLVEKMALFWHGHFATSVEKVKSLTLMENQIDLFRSHGLGSFEQLLLGVSQDPAMLVWLDNSKSKKEAPNENYGRELMELFTLGVGNYTEADVKAASRAFTGWSIQLTGDAYVGDEDEMDPELMSAEEIAAKKKAQRAAKRGQDAGFAFRARWHDGDEKTFLGQSGNWDGEDILRIIVEQPACASFIARKLFSFLVWDNPDDETVAPLAEVFVESNGDIRAVVGTILRSPEFSSDEAYRVKVKSPAELVAGAFRTFGGGTASRELFRGMSQMGQTLFAPPNVGGWPSGLGWIGPSSLLGRYNLMLEVMSASRGTALNDEAIEVDAAALIIGQNPSTAVELVDLAVDRLLSDDIDPAQRDVLLAYLGNDLSFDPFDEVFAGKVRGLIRLVSTVPRYQLN